MFHAGPFSGLPMAKTLGVRLRGMDVYMGNIHVWEVTVRVLVSRYESFL